MTKKYTLGSLWNYSNKLKGRKVVREYLDVEIQLG